AKRLLALKVAVALEEQTQATAAKTPKSENEQNEDDENEQNEDEDNDDGKDDDDDEGGGGYTPLSVDALNKMTNAQILNELAVIGVSTKGSENKQQLIALYTKAVKE
ncbi:MAG: hypothetical protein FWF51_12020, partial [Chitinivibrionia bacterium]|nr:hypothetical protein [Chitinivibrionia bacterium]